MRRWLVKVLEPDLSASCAEASLSRDITSHLPAHAARELLDHLEAPPLRRPVIVQAAPQDGKGETWHFRCRATNEVRWDLEAVNPPRKP